uniref:Uncharacterized protein n=1 Tax=Anguilla anguilla TaxID=7936 RepID=A0A0E9TQS2_ANGAN
MCVVQHWQQNIHLSILRSQIGKHGCTDGLYTKRNC